MKKVLVVATYPIENPQHGGQKRASAIVHAYKERFDKVCFVAVFHKKIYKEFSRDDISLSLTSSIEAEKNPLTSDIICGNAVYNDPKVKKQFSELLMNYRPDILHIEQPFLYLGIKPLIAELGIKPKIVFGSQNIEAPMKKEILIGAGYAATDTIEPVKVIEGVERLLSAECDLLVACTDEDLLKHREMGAKYCVLAQNGIAEIKTTPSTVSRRRNWLRQLDIAKSILFVASAHPPSITGFYDMVGKGLGFLPRNAKVIMAGSVGEFFVDTVKSDNRTIEDATFWMRAHSCGRLSEEELAALLVVCDVIILPITEGGGSNLKTAEAILADKKVVATPHALRSFEWAEEFPNVWVAKSKKDFIRAIQDALKSQFVQRTAAQKKQAETVLWEYRLKEFTQEVAKL